MKWNPFRRKEKKTEDEKKDDDTFIVGTRDFLALPTMLTPEKEEEMINRVVSGVRKMGMETPAVVFFEMVKPVSYIGSQLGYYFAAPFAVAIGLLGFDWANLLSKRENIERILKKLEEEE